MKASRLFFLVFGVSTLAQDHFWVRFDANPAVVTAGESLTLSAFVDIEDGVAFTWDLGDGRTVNGQNPQVSYADSGAYQVTLRAVRGDGTEAPPFSRWVFANDPLASVDSRASAPFKFINTPLNGETAALGTEICFDGHALDNEGDAVTLYWDFDDGTVLSGMDSVKKSYFDPGPYFPKLWAMDSSGLVETYPTFAAIHVFEGGPPPDGKILLPETNRIAFNQSVHEIKAGEPLQLKGEIAGVEDPSGYMAYWIAYGNGEPLTADGLMPEPVVWPPDYYYLYFHVIDPDGVEDPIVDEVQVWVRDDNRPPEQVGILSPNADAYLQPGEGLDLAANAVDLDGDALTFEWELSDGRRFTGQQINHVTFPDPGLYRIDVVVRDGLGGEARPSIARYAMVQAGRCAELPPAPLRITPQEARLAGPPGSRFSFEAAIEVPPNQQVEEVFWDFSHGIEGTSFVPDAVTFSEPGWYPVRLFLRNACGNWRGSEEWSVYIYGDNIPPESTITMPQPNVQDAGNRQVFAIVQGGTVDLAAIFADPDGNYPLTVRWEISEIDGETGEVETRVHSVAQTPPPVTFQQPGRKTVELFVFDSRGVQEVFPEPLEVLVVDPSLKPDSKISLPDGDFTVAPGVPVSFEGYGEDPNGLAVSYSWDFGPQAEPPAAEGPWVPSVVFNQPSPEGEPYTVRLTASTPFAQDETPATVRVTVRQFEDSAFEPNDELSQAANIQQGVYNQLVLEDSDNADIYTFEIDAEERDLRLNVAGSGLETTIYRFENGVWQNFPFDAYGSQNGLITIQDVPMGQYAVALTRMTAAKRRAVAYGLSIATVQPSQHLPFMVADTGLRSYLGVINPTGDEVFVQAIGLNSAGLQIADIGFRLRAGERRYLGSLVWFGSSEDEGSISEIRWVRLSSTRRLVSYMVTESLDGTQLMSSGGIAALTDQVMIPHIANPDNGWYTRAVVVNGQGVAETVNFQSPELAFEIANPADGNSQQDFRFRDRVNGALPGWGQFANTSSSAALAGVEVFGRTDAKRQMSAIEMIDVRRSNPNFVYIGNDIYFTHIAKDTQNWWTGISLINTDTEPANYRIVGYDSDGNEVVRMDAETLPPGGKLLKTSQTIFGDLGVDWMKIEGDGRIAGFELFGDPNLDRAAGFKAATFLTDDLIFPHVTVRPPMWTGISLVNVSGQATPITIGAYNDRGVLLAETSQTLAPFAKRLDLAQNLFGADGLPAGTSYLRVRGGQRSLCGFELFGTLNMQTGGPGNQLAGLAAIPF